MNCVLLKMGGSGVRFGYSVPKQYYEINNEPLFAYVLKKYAKISCVDKFIIVTHQDWLTLTEDYAKKILGDKLLSIINGGQSNLESSYKGIMESKKFLCSSDVILVHDITDPILVYDTIKSVALEAAKFGAVVPMIEQVHTLYTKDNNDFVTGTADRSIICSSYSPEGFLAKVVWDAFDNVDKSTFEKATSVMSIVQQMGVKAKLIPSHQLDLKITYREDMESLRMLIENGEKIYDNRD